MSKSKHEKVKVVILVGDGGTAATKLETNGKASYQGFSYDVYKEIKHMYNKKYTFEETFWEDFGGYSNVVKAVNSGKYDIAIGSFFYTKERSKLINYTVPHSLDSITILQKKEKLSFFNNFIFLLKNAWRLILVLIVIGVIFGITIFVTDPKRLLTSSDYIQEKSHLFFHRTILTGISTILGEMGLITENSSLTIISIVTVIIIMLIAFIFSNFIQAEIINLLIKKPKSTITKQNIRNKYLMGYKGYASVTKIKRLGPEIEEVEGLTLKKFLQRFLDDTDNKYDGMIIGFNNIYNFIKENDDLIPGTGFGNEICGFVVHKNKEELLTDFNEAILELRANTKLTQICNTYYDGFDKPVCSLN